MATQNFNCGLDFGTSNSVISLTDKSTGKLLFSYSDKSLIYFPDTNEELHYIGKEAQERYIAEEMSGRLLKSVKTLLKQDSFTHTYICGRRYTPDQLVTLIIEFLKQKAEAFAGVEIRDVVLGRPAVFSKDEKQEQTAVSRLLLAARNAGFENIKLQLEPIAAAYYYESQLTAPQNVLVADFGAGTSDFTLIRLDPKREKNRDRMDDIVANGGIYIGGDSFDSEIMWHKVTPFLGRKATYQSFGKTIEVPNAIYHELKKWERSFLLKDCKLRRSMDTYYMHSGKNAYINNLRIVIDNNYIYSLFKSIEEAKINLSEKEETCFLFEKPEVQISDLYKLTEFGTIISSLIERIENQIVSLMDEAQLSFNEIDSVFITGGSSYVVPVRNVFTKYFAQEKIKYGDAFNSVAYGLSLDY